MTDKPSANFPALVSREQAGNEINKALRLFVGRGRRYSVKQLANATGVPDRVIECAMTSGYDHRSLPDWALLSLMKFLGPEFTNEFLGLAGQTAVEEGPLDHERIATDAIDYLSTKTAAHHPESEWGPAIGPSETQNLDRKVVKLARVA